MAPVSGESLAGEERETLICNSESGMPGEADSALTKLSQLGAASEDWAKIALYSSYKDREPERAPLLVQQGADPQFRLRVAVERLTRRNAEPNAGSTPAKYANSVKDSRRAQKEQELAQMVWLRSCGGAAELSDGF